MKSQLHLNPQSAMRSNLHYVIFLYMFDQRGKHARSLILQHTWPREAVNWLCKYVFCHLTVL
jgi:hypothetical protein